MFGNAGRREELVDLVEGGDDLGEIRSAAREIQSSVLEYLVGGRRRAVGFGRRREGREQECDIRFGRRPDLSVETLKLRFGRQTNLKHLPQLLDDFPLVEVHVLIQSNCSIFPIL